MGRIRVGLSGWDYAEWRGDFYPDDLPRKQELSYVGGRFDTVEVNGTFYSLGSPKSFRRWAEAVPDDFVFAVKGSRFITHNKKLADVDVPLANFLASGVLELDQKLGPVLWQLPAGLHFDRARVEGFLARLPHDTKAAARMARRHDDRVQDAAYGPGANHRLRHVLEIRHQSYLCDEMATVARSHGVALAFSHSSDWPYTEEITSGFVYVRLHGPGRLYASPYGEEGLRDWADRLVAWQRGGQPEDAIRIGGRVPPPRAERDVYVYFDNDSGGHAFREAAYLRERISET